MVKSYCFNLVCGGMLDEVYRKKADFDRLSRDLGLPCYGKKWKGLQEDAARHSVGIEMVGNGRRSGTRKQETRRCLRNLHDALEWGNVNYTPELTGDYILEVGKRVEPEVNQYGYRTDRVRLKTARGYHIPISPEKLEAEIDSFLFENSCIDDPVEKAIHAHFHIARIHPFLDGNGRTARAIQNIYLEKAGFFPVNINCSERLRYIDTLSRAIDSYRVAETRLVDGESLDFLEFNGLLAKPSLSLDQLRRCKSLAIALAKRKMTPEKTEFFNYLATKMIQSYVSEIGRVQSTAKIKAGYHPKRKNRRGTR